MARILTADQEEMLTTLMVMLRTEGMLSAERIKDLDDAIRLAKIGGMSEGDLQILFARIAAQANAEAVQVNVGAEAVGKWRIRTLIFGVLILLGWSAMAVTGITVAEIWALFISIPSLIGSAIMPPVPMSGMPAAAAAAAPNATAAVVETIKAAVAADTDQTGRLGSTIYGIMGQLSTSIIQATIACIGSAIGAVTNAICALINIEYGNHLAAIFELSVKGALAWTGIKATTFGVDMLSGKHDAAIALTPDFIARIIQMIGDAQAVAGHDIYDANGNLVLRWDPKPILYRADATFAKIISEAWMLAVNLRRIQNPRIIDKTKYEEIVKKAFTSFGRKDPNQFTRLYGMDLYTLTSLLMNEPTPLPKLKEVHSASGFPAEKEQVSPRADSMHNLVGNYSNNTFNLYKYTKENIAARDILKAKAAKPPIQAGPDYATQFHAKYIEAFDNGWPVDKVFSIRLSDLDGYKGVNYTFYDLVSNSPNWSDVLSNVIFSLNFDKGNSSNPELIPRAFEAGMALLMNPAQQSREISTSSSINVSSAKPRVKPTPIEGELTFGELTRQIGLPLENEITYAELAAQKVQTEKMLKQNYHGATTRSFFDIATKDNTILAKRSEITANEIDSKDLDMDVGDEAGVGDGAKKGRMDKGGRKSRHYRKKRSTLKRRRIRRRRLTRKGRKRRHTKRR